jgi:hypothetical protein
MAQDQAAPAAPEATDSIETQDTAAETPETTQETQAQTKPAQSSTPSKRKFKLKVDGEEFEEEFDPNDDEYITRQLQMAKVAGKRMEEFSSLQKEVVKFIEDLRKDPARVLSDPHIGLDVKKLAADIIEKEIADSKKSPEQLAKEKLEAELKALKEEREREKQAALEEQKQRLTEEQYERYDILMDQALQKTDLPKSPYIVKKIADYMLVGLQNGKDVLPEDVIPLVREEVMEDLKSMFQVMPDEVVEKLVGKDKINSIRKKNVARAKEKVAVGSNKTLDVGKKAEPKETGKKVNFKTFFGV